MKTNRDKLQSNTSHYKSMQNVANQPQKILKEMWHLHVDSTAIAFVRALVVCWEWHRWCLVSLPLQIDVFHCSIWVFVSRTLDCGWQESETAKPVCRQCEHQQTSWESPPGDRHAISAQDSRQQDADTHKECQALITVYNKIQSVTCVNNAKQHIAWICKYLVKPFCISFLQVDV